MKRWALYLFLCCLAFSVHGAPSSSIKYASHIRPALQKLKSNELMDFLRQVVKEGKPARIPGTPGHAKVVDYLQTKLAEFDPNKTGQMVVDKFTPDVEHAVHFYEEDFRQKVEGKFAKTSSEYKGWLKFTNSVIAAVKKFKTVPGQNILWIKKGTEQPDEWMVIGAHYDTIGMDQKTNLPKLEGTFPGADYNASGVAVLLGIVKQLAQIDLKKTVVVAFFDYQGPGFLGSHQFAKVWMKGFNAKKSPYMMLNLEMLGNDTTSDDKEKKSGNMKAYLSKPDSSTYATELAWFETCEKGTARGSYGVTFKPEANGFEFSDNISFWAHGVPAVTFSQNWEEDFNQKRYQSSNDFPETINQKTLYNSYQFIGFCALNSLLDLKGPF